LVELLTLDPTGERARMLLAARAAPVAAGAFVASLVGYALLVPLAPAYGALADVAGLLLALASVGLAMGFAELTWKQAPTATTLASVLGVIAGLAAAALDVAQLAGQRGVVPGSGLAFAALGAWLAASNALAFTSRTFPRWAALLGLLAGAGFAVGGLFAGLQGPGQAALVVAGALTVAGFPAWCWAARAALLRQAGAPQAQPLRPMLNA
jgi:hypothetical protein